VDSAKQVLLKVLIVEHDPDDVELTLAALREGGYDVQADVASKPADFVRLLNEKTFDVVLSDFRIPGWSGMDAFNLLRKEGKTIPFLLVTGTLGDEMAVSSIQQGVTDYVLKDRLVRLPHAIDRALREELLRQERMRAERALQISETGLQFLFANHPLPMFVYDLQKFNFIQVNDAAVRFYGFSHEEFMEISLHHIRPPGDASKLLNERTTAPETDWFAGEWRHRKKDGSIADVVIVRHLIQLAGRSAGLAVVQDVTARKRSEQALADSEARYRELVENATYGIFRVTVAGKFLEVNPSLVRMLGFNSKEELLELPHFDFYRNPVDREHLLREYRRTGRLDSTEVEWRRKDNQFITVRLSGRGVTDEASGAECLEIIVEDVTERRALEKQLRQAQKFEAIGQLAGGIAHDFNNVIGAVMGWAELGAEQAPKDGRLEEYFKKIRGQTARAAGLTRQLLAFARRQILAPQNLQVNSIVTDVLSLLEKVIGKDIEIKTILDPDLATVRADPSQLEQVLMNLCLNSRDAMPGGGHLIIETRNADVTEEMARLMPGISAGRHVELAVSDDGTGMDAATREHIFEPFFTTKEPGKGTGLGLATVFGIVKQHDGMVSVQSEPGVGTTFRILLPAAKIAGESPDAQSKLAEHTMRGGSETILIAEDHEGVREMASAALESCGYRVLAAVDGDEAVKIFRENAQAISLVVMDIVMPRLGGRDAAALIRAIRPEVPVIFTTGYSADNEALTHVVEMGGTLLHKPYDPKKLTCRVRELLDGAAVPAGVPSMQSAQLFPGGRQ
jgi:two-component system, cell cycle sensor histidine kinase and response regulator CckA